MNAAEHIGVLDFERVHQADRVIREARGGERARRILAPAHARVIVDQRAVMLGEFGNLEGEPTAARSPGSHDQDQRNSGVLSVEFVVDLARADDGVGHARMVTLPDWRI